MRKQRKKPIIGVESPSQEMEQQSNDMMMRSVSGPGNDHDHLEFPVTPIEERFNRFTFEVIPKAIEEIPSFRAPTPTIKELKSHIKAKNPPGQWFRRKKYEKIDITCLPVELHIEILQNVTFLDQLSCELVCSTWRTIIRRDCASFRYTAIDDSAWTGIKAEEDNAKSLQKAKYPVTKAAPDESASEKPKILIHRLLQDGSFAFRQFPGSTSVEMMSTFHPILPHHPPRRFKIENLSFLNDPIAIYTASEFRNRSEVPTLDIEFDSEPLRNEFRLRIGGRFSTASTVYPVPPILPRLPGMPHTPQHPQPYPTWYLKFSGKPSTRLAMRSNYEFKGMWDLGAFLLGVQGKLESPMHWYEQTALERNARWNGKDFATRWKTGNDPDGDWDMDRGFQEPLTLAQITMKEAELLEIYKRNGFWFYREFGKDKKKDEMHVALLPVSEWVWEISY
ncbi:hypothetical protein ABW19_dt0207345 [Dactylella cylindrospora]|nr:hypothetical protein ABW19_dt0207345 [Dactylella cylindrospora]